MKHVKTYEEFINEGFEDMPEKLNDVSIKSKKYPESEIRAGEAWSSAKGTYVLNKFNFMLESKELISEKDLVKMTKEIEKIIGKYIK